MDLAVRTAASAGMRRTAAVAISFCWLVFQFYIIASPQDPLIERPVHLVFAQVLVLLTFPLGNRFAGARLLDWILLAGTVGVGLYYLRFADRLSARIEMVDPIYAVDLLAGAFLLVSLLEAVRRVVGWSLLSLLLLVFLYAFAGPAFPGWSRFSGFGFAEVVEMMTMTTNGVLGITTETSVQFVFFFVLFGIIYAAIGGGRLFIDIGLAATARHQGGAAKAAVVSSSLMGTVSGSAVANVVSVGVFTIPLMRRTGYSAEQAAGIEAICSTGGQLMPPVMGVAAFVLAEMLQIEYGRVALAGVIPALAFYCALFIHVDLAARKTGQGTLSASALRLDPIAPRLYLLLPPMVLVGALASGYSATISAIIGTLACVVVCYMGRATRMSVSAWRDAVSEVGKQACQVAVPIASIGIVIAVAIQSNLALRFSTRLIEGSEGNIYGALLLTILGCIIMGMGLPTVAAYIIGAVLFVPVLLKLGIVPLAAHFFVMYYCVLSMVTPPVALASFAAAGVAGADTMRTGWYAFRLSLVLFLIPFGFVFDTRLLWEGPGWQIAAAFVSVLAATAAWAIALVGYFRRPLAMLPRIAFGVACVAVILFPTGSLGWSIATLALLTLTLLTALRTGASAVPADNSARVMQGHN